MSLTLRWGTVTAVTQHRAEIVRCEVDGAPCVAYPRQTGGVEVDDTVLVNAQSRELGLGSGGFDIVVANLTRGLGLEPPLSTHVMSLPYTSAQSATACVEESDPLADDLEGLRSCARASTANSHRSWQASAPGVRVAYAQLAGGALPVALSDTIRLLRTRRLLETAIGVARVSTATSRQSRPRPP